LNGMSNFFDQRVISLNMYSPFFGTEAGGWFPVALKIPPSKTGNISTDAPVSLRALKLL